MKKNVIIGAVVIGAVAVATPYFIGMGVESQFNQKITLVNNKLAGGVNPDGAIKITDYQRGWFSSTARTVIKDTLVINHEIAHGPFGYFGLAKVNSIIEMPETKKKQLEDFFDGQKPYTMTTEVSFSGASTFVLSSPALKDVKAIPTDANSSIAWKGFNLTNKTSGDQSITTIDMPLLVINVENKAEITVDGFSFKRDGYRQFDKQLNFVIPERANVEAVFGINKIAVKVNEPAGGESGTLLISDIKSSGNLKDNRYNADFNIGNINADFDSAKFSIANISSNAKGEDGLVFLRKKLADSNWSLQTSADANKIDFAINDQENFRVQLDYHQEQKLNDNSVTFSYGELYRASNINVAAPNYSNNIINGVQFNYQLDGLPKKEAAVFAENYISMIKTAIKSLLLEGNVDALSFSDALGKSMQQLAVATLQTTPSFSSNLSLSGGKGAASVNIQAKLDSTDNATKMGLLLMKLAKRADSVLSIQISEPLLDEVLQLVATKNEQSADEMKAEILKKVPFVVKEGELKLDIEYKGSLFYMNGQKVGSINEMGKLIRNM